MLSPDACSVNTKALFAKLDAAYARSDLVTAQTLLDALYARFDAAYAMANITDGATA